MHAFKRSSLHTVRTLRCKGRGTDPVFLRDPKLGNVLVVLQGLLSPFNDMISAAQDLMRRTTSNLEDFRQGSADSDWVVFG